MHSPKEVAPGSSLAGLIKACETFCVADCCGIDAFDFSLLRITAALTTYTGDVSPTQVAAIETDIDRLEAEVATLTSSDDGTICSIVGMNQHFSKKELYALTKQWKSALRQAPRLAQISESMDSGNGG